MRSDYEIGHIPGAISMPYEEIKDRMKELNKDDLLHYFLQNRTKNRLVLQALQKG